MSLFAGQDREALRDAWRTAWQRHLQRLPLEPLQVQMADLIALHPEYHSQLSATPAAAAAADADATTTANSFLHLSLHLALREQLGTNRPAGIAAVYRTLSATALDPHALEHRMIEVLAQTLWDAQRAGRMPDERQYLDGLRGL